MTGSITEATSLLRIWLAAARPHTLSAAVVPVLVGSALAAAEGPFLGWVFALTLLGALLVQVGANLTDEYADHGATASAHKYPAPHKVIARGLLSEAQVKRGALAVFGAATLVGLVLVLRGGWPLLVVCLVALLLAWAYSAGPLPLGDLALGELLVFVAMGPLMVVATTYVQTLHWSALALWHALPVGALVTAILIVNNLRDAEEDARNGRRTLVTVWGEPPVQRLYLALLGGAYLVPAVAVAAGWNAPWVLLTWLTLPLAARAVRLVRSGEQVQRHRGLKATSALHAAYGLLLAVALLVGGLG